PVAVPLLTTSVGHREGWPTFVARLASGNRGLYRHLARDGSALRLAVGGSPERHPLGRLGQEALEPEPQGNGRTPTGLRTRRAPGQWRLDCCPSPRPFSRKRA